VLFAKIVAAHVPSARQIVLFRILAFG